MGKNWRANEKGYEHHFRIMREPCSVYRHFDVDGRLLYVGIARNAKLRRSQHRSDGGWGRSIARTTVVQYQTRAEAIEVEARAIAFERPLHNKKRPYRPLGVRADATKCPLLADLFLRKEPVTAQPSRPPRKPDLPKFDYAEWIRCMSEAVFYEE